MDATHTAGIERDREKGPALRRGFTMIELLVVIGIIAALAGILFPVFAQAREKGRRAACTSNQRQIAAAMQQYTQDFDGVYPHEMFAYNIGGVSTLIGWTEVLQPYAKSKDMFRCPGQGPALPKLGLPYDGYTLNDEDLNTFHWSGAKPAEGILTVRGKHESVFLDASSVWLSGDRIALENGQCVQCASGWSSCGGNFVGGSLHNKGGNYSFLDGHVRWFTPLAMAELDCKNAASARPPAPE